MSEDSAARRTVTPAEIRRLGDLLDRFESADDPESGAAKAAEEEYFQTVHDLVEQCVKPYYESVTLEQFRGHVRWRCREYLAIQTRKPPTPPS